MRAHSEDGSPLGVFEFCTKLENVRLPESLRRIGFQSFYHCSALVHVHIPPGVSEFGEGIFSHCDSLATATIPEGIVDLPEYTFSSCFSLKSVKLPSSLRTIGSSAFRLCSSLTAINFEDIGGVTDIGKEAFMGCASLTTIKLPPLVKSIEADTFSYCRSLSKVELPPCLEAIKSHAFYCCHRALRINLPEEVNYVMSWSIGMTVGLPTSLSVLTNGGDVLNLLQGAMEVVISSRVNLGLLAEYLSSLPKRRDGQPFLYPALKFRVLYSGSNSATLLPALSKHIPISFFSFSLSCKDLLALAAKDEADDSLLKLTETAFVRRVSIYAQFLKTTNLPEDILHYILPFMHGDRDCLTDEMLGHIVATAKEILQEASLPHDVDNHNSRIKVGQRRSKSSIPVKQVSATCNCC